jgi:hypothetical protein
MKCYYHKDSDAVGLCKACSKGICHECAADVGGGLACQATCTEVVRSINALVAASTTKVAQQLRGSYFWAALLLILGILFVIGPVLSGRPMLPFTTAAGFVFCAFGILLGVYQRAFNKAFRDSAQQVAAGDAQKTRA